MSNTKSWTLIITWLVIASFINSSCWADVYHCNGRVLRYPCSEPHIILAKSAKAFAKGSKQSQDLSLTPIVSQEALKRLPQNQGLWHGRVHGNGLVKLELRIFRAGTLEATRKMGEVYLKDKSTAFNFKSSLPAGADWTWEIKALSNDQIG